MLSLGIEPMILALLAPCSTIWATGKPTLLFQPQLITTMYIQLQYINRKFVVLHTCTQTLFHTQHSREMQEIFKRAHNKKRQYFIEPFLIKSVRCKHEHFWRSFLSTCFISFNHSCRRFFVWQWQQVCDQISNLRLYYINFGTQHHNKMILAPYVAESALVWMGSSPFVLLPA